MPQADFNIDLLSPLYLAVTKYRDSIFQVSNRSRNFPSLWEHPEKSLCKFERACEKSRMDRGKARGLTWDAAGNSIAIPNAFYITPLSPPSELPFLHILAISLTHTHVYLSISVAKDPSSRIANCTFEWNREKGSGGKFTDCKKIREIYFVAVKGTST